MTHIHTSGGRAAKPKSAIYKTAASIAGGPRHVFVKVAATEGWLNHCVTGKERTTGQGLGGMKLILEMRSKLGLAADGRDPNGQSTADGSTDDPMLELAAETHGSGDRQHTSEAIRGIRGQGHDRNRYYDNPARDTVVTLSLPTHCP